MRAPSALGLLLVASAWFFACPTLGCASTGSTVKVGAGASPPPSSGSTSPFRYHRLPLDDNRVDPAMANQCFYDCQSVRTSGQPAFLRCLSSCPGWEEGHGTCGADDLPPRAYCVDEVVRQDSANAAEAVGTVIGAILGTIVVVVVCVPHPEACKDDDD